MENKKTKIISIVAIIALALTLITATFAYFQAQTGEGSQTDIKINASTVDTLSFETGSAISLTMDQESFASGKGNATGTTFAKAILTANNKTNTATDSYNLFLNISDNNFKYTDSATYPELLLTIKDGSNNEVTSISGLTYKTVTDGKKTTVKGFDITTKTGLITLLSNRAITTTSSKTDTWNITVTFVNYDKDQSANAGKSFSGQVLISKDSFEDYTPNTINTLSATKSGSNLTVNLNVEQGSNEIDKYYYAIEEKSAVAYTNTSNIKKLASTLSSSSINYIESASSSYTFTNIDSTKNYNVYAYAIDKNKIKTNTYEFKYYSDLYVYPVINKVETSTTSNSITATVTATKGTNNISKYYYSIDGGNTFVESVNNSYTFSGLQKGTYQIITKIMDSSNKYSNIYVKGAITSDIITFTFEDAKYKAKSEMTLQEWIDSEYNTWGYYVTDSSLLSKTLNDGDSINIYPTDRPLTSSTEGAEVKKFTENNFKELNNYDNISDEALIKLKSMYKGNFSKFSDYQNITNTTIKNNRMDIYERLEGIDMFYLPYIFKVTDKSLISPSSDNKYMVSLNVWNLTKDLTEIRVLIYDTSTNLFKIDEIEPENIDITNKIIEVGLTDNTIITLIIDATA